MRAISISDASGEIAPVRPWELRGLTRAPEASNIRTPFGDSVSARGEPTASDLPDGVGSGRRLAASALGRAANPILREVLRIVRMCHVCDNAHDTNREHVHRRSSGFATVRSPSARITSAERAFENYRYLQLGSGVFESK
jgi:hypothetical protein